jgi:uncharacterized membrane-anchored protein
MKTPTPLLILTIVASFCLGIGIFHVWQQSKEPKSILQVHEVLRLDAELNYRMAIEAASNSIGTDSAICDTMFVYGFDLKGNPFYQPTDFEKVNALKTTKFK